MNPIKANESELGISAKDNRVGDHKDDKVEPQAWDKEIVANP